MKNILYKSHWKLARINLVRHNQCWIQGGVRYFSSKNSDNMLGEKVSTILLVTDLQNNIKYSFSSVYALSKELGIAKSNVLRLMKKSNCFIVKKRWEINVVDNSRVGLVKEGSVLEYKNNTNLVLYKGKKTDIIPYVNKVEVLDVIPYVEEKKWVVPFIIYIHELRVDEFIITTHELRIVPFVIYIHVLSVVPFKHKEVSVVWCRWNNIVMDTSEEKIESINRENNKEFVDFEGNIYDDEVMMNVEQLYELDEKLGQKYFAKFKLAWCFKNITLDNFVRTPIKVCGKIVWKYFNELKGLNDYNEDNVYSTSIMCRYVRKGGLTNEPQYKMVGNNSIHTGKANLLEFAWGMARNVNEIATTYPDFYNFDIIVTSNSWLSEEDYQRLLEKKKLTKKDIGKIVNKVSTKRVENNLLNLGKTPKEIKEISVVKYVERLNSLFEKIGINFNVANLESFILRDPLKFSYFKELNDDSKIIGSVKFDDKNDNVKNIEIIREYYTNETRSSQGVVICERIMFKYEGINNNRILVNGGNELSKYSINIIYLVDTSSIDVKVVHSEIVNGKYEYNYKKLSECLRFEEWEDNKKDIIRCVNNDSNRLIYKDKVIHNIEIEYKFPKFKQIKKDIEYEEKIGCIDLETYLDENGNSVVYSAACVVGSEDKCYVEYGDNPDEIIYNLFNSIFEGSKNLKEKDRVKYFYAHNGSSFDFIFIINSLCKYNEFTIKPVIKNSSQIIELKISKKVVKNIKSGKEYNQTIILRDSLLFLNQSLKKLAISFLNEDEKTLYPYAFVNKNNLYYKGIVPNIEFFNNPKDQETIAKYNEILSKGDVYDLKEETIKYIKNDCVILYKILLKFKQIIYDHFEINIERSKTCPGLALNIYLSNYYKPEMDLRVISGDIEKHIRSSYFGGFAKVYDNKIENAHHYDMNSQYPYVMKNDIPTGNPIFSRSKNLNDYFGTVYAEVTMTENVKTPLLYHKNERGFSVLNNDKEFKGFFFSEELKYAVKAGYKVNVLGGFKFKRNSNVFKEFVDDLYKLKLEAEQNKDKSKRQVFKLILVSLFGRMGQKEIEDRCVIVSKEEAEKIVKIKHYSKAIPMGDDKTLIIHQGYVDQELLNMIEENSDPVNPLERTRGVISSIPVAAAITAYGRMSITKFLLMDNLKVHYIVTDGITIDQKLPDEMVSSDLGAMKHEYGVKEGIIITVNTLCIKTNEGKEITKCAGFNAKSGYVVKNNNENDKSNKLSYKEYQSLYEGEDVKLSHEIWRSSLETGTVQITRQEFNIKGLRNKS